MKEYLVSMLGDPPEGVEFQDGTPVVGPNGDEEAVEWVMAARRLLMFA